MAQINFTNFKIPEWFKWLGWLLFILTLFFNSCSNDQEKTKKSIKVEEVTKTIPAETSVNHSAISPNEMTKEISKKGQILSKNNLQKNDLSNNDNLKVIDDLKLRLKYYQEEIELLQEDFIFQDSIKKQELYKLATELKSFESLFEDDNLKLKINGIIGANKVKELTPTYTIKSKTYEVPQLKYRLLAGAGAGINQELNQGVYSFNFGLQNKNANIYSLSYLSVGNVKYGVFSYYLNLYTYKK